MKTIGDRLNYGYDIKSGTKGDFLYGIEYGEVEKNLYEDNCKPVNVDGELICLRLRWCGGVDVVWQRKANRRLEQLRRSELL